MPRPKNAMEQARLALIDEVCADRDRLRSQLESLHKRLRGLAVDCGAVQTDDAVEDVRKVVAEKQRELGVMLLRAQSAEALYRNAEARVQEGLRHVNVLLRDGMALVKRNETLEKQLAAAKEKP